MVKITKKQSDAVISEIPYLYDKWSQERSLKLNCKEWIKDLQDK